MNRITAVFAALALLCLPPLLPADGVANADGYTYADGYYFKDGIAYTQKQNWYKDWYQEPYTYSYYGCYYTAYRWTYSWKSTNQYYPVQLKPSGDWRTQLLGIAAARDKVEGKLRIYAQEQTNFEASVKALGLDGNFRWQNYGVNSMPLYSANGNLQLSSAGVQGNTVYGYSYSSVADVYGNVDLNALYQQASRLTENAQTLAGQAHTDFADLVKQEGGNRARVAEILAKSQAAATVLKAAEGPNQAQIQTRVFRFEIRPNGETTLTPVQPQQPAPVVSGEWLKLSGPSSCVKCHAGGTVQAGFDITKYNPTTATAEFRQKLLSRLLSDDPKVRMPKDGNKLTTEQIMQFIAVPQPMPKAD